MKKILFLIHDLGQGGAEKVLVNLVNNMDYSKFDITVMALFGGGVNEQFLAKNIHLINCHRKAFPGNSHLMKFFAPKRLYRHYIKEHYDIVVSYLEGPSARIVSGCDDATMKTVSWVHCTMQTENDLKIGFRNLPEAIECYEKYDVLVFVSDGVKQAFLKQCPYHGTSIVLYNTNQSARILEEASRTVDDEAFMKADFRIVGVGKVTENKGFDRLARIHKRLRNEGYPVHTYILGAGPQQNEIQRYLQENGLTDSYTFLGYQSNPYQYVAKSDLYVCASHAEGFSTAATEALIVGTPVCTVEVSGMKEMLGEDDEWGIVTKNDEDALFQGIKQLLDDPDLLSHYKEKAIERGKAFSTEDTVRAVEEMFLNL